MGKMRKSEDISFSLCDCEGPRVVVALGFQEARGSNINRRNPRGFVRIPNTLGEQSFGSWESIQIFTMGLSGAYIRCTRFFRLFFFETVIFSLDTGYKLLSSSLSGHMRR